MADRRPYPSDLSDARWELIEPVLAAWRYERHGRALGFGRPAELDLREIMNAILYVDRTGVQWRYLPHDFPQRNQVLGQGLQSPRFRLETAERRPPLITIQEHEQPPEERSRGSPRALPPAGE